MRLVRALLWLVARRLLSRWPHRAAFPRELGEVNRFGVPATTRTIVCETIRRSFAGYPTLVNESHEPCLKMLRDAVALSCA